MTDLLIRGGLVVDGTGTPVRRADVAVVADRIVAVAPDLRELADGAGTVVEAAGLVVGPGFVDIHTHSDLTLLSSPLAPSALSQGTTTQVVGNCGLGVAPRTSSADLGAIRAAAGYLDLDPDVALDWTTVRGYLARLTAARPALNVLTFVPHGPVRASAVGFDARPSSPAEVDTMVGLVTEGLQDGAVGLSTGLVYAPVCFAEEDELLALGRTVAAADRLFAWHIRDYTDHLLESVAQCLRVARATGCRTQVSHLASVGRRNWGGVQRALEMVDEFRRDGLDVGVDIYPYLAGNAPLAQAIPAELQAGGDEALKERLDDPATVRALFAEWADRAVGWDETVVSWLPEPADPGVVGRRVTEIAAERGESADAVVLDLLRRHGSSALGVYFGRDARDLQRVLRHPATVVASDGLALDPTGPTGRGTPHPRCYGCFPRYLSEYGRDDLPDAVRRCTSAPAARVGLTDRGRVAAGLVADLVLLDLPTLRDTATFERPHQMSTGVRHVLVSGRFAVHDGRLTGTRAGQVVALTG
ncbi:MAG: amidohydrolase family protein [Actinomycetota bacterium]|nr:amidohydrolase family protein [Actinomycetota bacterium]